MYNDVNDNLILVLIAENKEYLESIQNVSSLRRNATQDVGLKRHLETNAKIHVSNPLQPAS